MYFVFLTNGGTPNRRRAWVTYPHYSPLSMGLTKSETAIQGLGVRDRNVSRKCSWGGKYLSDVMEESKINFCNTHMKKVYYEYTPQELRGQRQGICNPSSSLAYGRTSTS